MTKSRNKSDNTLSQDLCVNSVSSVTKITQRTTEKTRSYTELESHSFDAIFEERDVKIQKQTELIFTQLLCSSHKRHS